MSLFKPNLPKYVTQAFRSVAIALPLLSATVAKAEPSLSIFREPPVRTALEREEQTQIKMLAAGAARAEAMPDFWVNHLISLEGRDKEASSWRVDYAKQQYEVEKLAFTAPVVHRATFNQSAGIVRNDNRAVPVLRAFAFNGPN